MKKRKIIKTRVTEREFALFAEVAVELNLSHSFILYAVIMYVIKHKKLPKGLL